MLDDCLFEVKILLSVFATHNVTMRSPAYSLQAESNVDSGHLLRLDLLLERFKARLVGLMSLQVLISAMLREHLDAQRVVLVLEVANLTFHALHR